MAAGGTLPQVGQGRLGSAYLVGWGWGCTTNCTYGVPQVLLLGLYPPCSIAIKHTGFLRLCPSGAAALSIAAKLLLPLTP